MLLGIPKFLQDKLVQLRLLFSDTNEQVALNGSIVNAVFMEGRKDISIVNIQFNANEIPMSYKFHINRYITSYQKKIIENQMKNAEAAAKAAEEEAKKAEEAKAAREKKIAENMAAEKEEEKNAILAKVAAAKAAQNTQGGEQTDAAAEGEKPAEAQAQVAEGENPAASEESAGESPAAEAPKEEKAEGSEPKASEGSDEIIDTEGHEFIKSAAEEKAESFKNKLDDQLESAIENATDISK